MFYSVRCDFYRTISLPSFNDLRCKLLREGGKIGPQVVWQQLVQSTMMSRFEIVDGEYIEELKYKSENENTMKSSEWWKDVFKKWAIERNL